MSPEYIDDMNARVATVNFETACSFAFRLRPRLFIDGNQWCALYGDNVQDGVAGFGDTPELAFADFDKNFREQRAVSHAAVALGSIKSPRKAKSSRENGKKGGRPKKST